MTDRKVNEVKNKGLLTTAVVALVVVIGYDYAKNKGMKRG